MNAVNSANDFTQDNAGSGSDSDTNSDDSPRYYQPISSQPEDEAVQISDQQNQNSNNNGNSHRFNCPNSDSGDDSHRFRWPDVLSNGYTVCVENGVLSLDLTDKEEESDVEGEEEERMRQESEEEERMRQESEEAIRRAFREDERRRNAPLAPENATRVRAVMRGVSFGGLAPEWAGQIPEDRWIDQLRRMRQSP